MIESFDPNGSEGNEDGYGCLIYFIIAIFLFLIVIGYLVFL